MRIAFLFNSDHEMYGGYYGDPIRTTILQTDVLQSANRHMKVKVGDVLIYSHSKTRRDLVDLSEVTTFIQN